MPRRRFARLYQTDPEVQGPWGEGYENARDGALAATLDDPELLELFRAGAQLPRGFGFALDERIVELPWIVANLDAVGEPVLDAGSALNHRLILGRVIPRVGSLTIVTFTEEDAIAGFSAEYATADLRELPFAEGSFAAITCVSTLEHVGMDNSDYGSTEPPSDDPDREAARAIAELRRVLRPGGRLLLTIPYGREEDHGWCRQFDAAGVRRIREWFGQPEAPGRVYAHSLRGWQLSSLEDAADARYRDTKVETRPQRDCAYAARAVVCITLTRPG